MADNKTYNFEPGQTVRCKREDPMDDHCRIADENRWHVGDEFVIDRVDVQVYGTFLHDGKGHNLDADRAELVIK